MRRLHRLEHFFAVHRFHLGAVGFDDVDGKPVTARLGHRPLEDFLGAGAPHADFDSIFFLEAGDQRAHVVGLRGGIEAEGALFFRAVDQPLQPIGTGILGQLGHVRAWRRLCRGGCLPDHDCCGCGYGCDQVMKSSLVHGFVRSS